MYIFIMVVGAAALHASWNFIARKTKGDLSVIFLSLQLAAILYLPVMFFFNFFPILQDTPSLTAFSDALPLGIVWGTGFIHAFYFIFLGYSYKHGEISVVYPIARGTGIALTCIFAYFFLGERTTPMGGVGIAAISVGVLVLGLKWDLFFKKNSSYQQVEMQSLPQFSSAVIQSDSAAAENDETAPEFGISEEETTTPPSSSPPASPSLSSKNETATMVEVELHAPSSDVEKTDPIKEDSKEGLVTKPTEGNLGDPPSAAATRNSLIFAIIVGVTISAYSLVDKIGVSVAEIDPFTFGFFLAQMSVFGMAPYMFFTHVPQCLEALKNSKKYIALVGPLTLFSYTAILFAYNGIAVSYVIALREVSVVIGALLGFIFLKEKVTVPKVIGIILIVCGLALVKIG